MYVLYVLYIRIPPLAPFYIVLSLLYYTSFINWPLAKPLMTCSKSSFHILCYVTCEEEET